MNRGLRHCGRLLGAWLLLGPAALVRSAGAQTAPPQRFTVGGQELFRLDFSSTAVGDFPATVQMLDGIMDVVNRNGQNMLRASSRSAFLVQLPQVLPQDFTLEFEIVPKIGGNPEDLAVEGTPTINQGINSANVLWHRDNLRIVGGGPPYDAVVPPSFAGTLPSRVTQVVIVMQGQTMKLYTNGRLMFAQSRTFARTRVLRVFLGGQDDGPNAVLLASMRVLNGVVVGPVATAGSTSGANPGAGAAGAGPAASPPSPLPPSQNPLPNVGPSGGGTSSGTAPVTGTAAPNPAGTTGSGTTLNPGVTRGTATALNNAPAAGNLSVTGQPLQARISWTAAPGATRYALRRAFAGTTTWTTVVDQGAPLTDAIDILPDHRRTYAYELFAYQADGSFGSVTANYTPPAPTDPGGFTATIIGPGEVKFDWNNVLDAHFRLDGPAAGGNGIWVVGMNPDPTARFTHTLKGIPVGTHTWSIASVYHPGGVMTAANAWPRASATVTTPDPAQRYRLTALGVRAINPSADDIFAVDGMGDEVYVAAVINSTTRTFVGTNISSATSATYGDVGAANAFPGRNRAGTYGATGGIKSGDLIPISLNLANPTGTPNILGFPLILWEGVLDDDAMIVVEPSLWEEDSDKALYTAFLGVASDEATKGYPNIASTITTLRDQGQVGPAANTQSGNVLWCCRGVAPDHPIGLELVGSTPFLPHRVVVLTKVAVESALNMSGQRAGSAPGVIVMLLQDRAPAGTTTAIYELYLRVERVP